MAFMHYTAAAEGVTQEQADEIYDRVGDTISELEIELDINFIAWGGSVTAEGGEIGIESVKAYRETAALLDKLEKIGRVVRDAHFSSDPMDSARAINKILGVLGGPDAQA